MNAARALAGTLARALLALLAGACLPGVVLDELAAGGGAAVDDLRFEDVGQRSFSALFTAVDGGADPIVRYELFVDTTAISAARIDALAAHALLDEAPASGDTVRIVVDERAAGTTYSVAVRASAASGAQSLSNVASVTTVVTLCPTNGRVAGTVTLDSAGSAATLGGLEGCTVVDGDLIVSDPGLSALLLDDLVEITGELRVSNANALAAISFATLTSAGGFSLIDDAGSDHALAAVNVPLLAAITDAAAGVEVKGDGLARAAFPRLAQLELPALAAVGRFTLSGTAVAAVAADALTAVAGDVSVVGNAELEAFALPALESAGGLLVNGNARLAALSFPALTSVGQQLRIEANGELSTCAALLALPVLEFATVIEMNIRGSVEGQRFDPDDPEAARGQACLAGDVVVPTDGLDTTVFDALRIVTGGIVAVDLPTQASLSFPVLRLSGDRIIVQRAAALERLALPALERVAPFGGPGGVSPREPVPALVVADAPLLSALDVDNLLSIGPANGEPGPQPILNVYRLPLLSSCEIAAVADRLQADAGLGWSIFDIADDALCPYCALDGPDCGSPGGSAVVYPAETGETGETGACAPFPVDATVAGLWRLDEPAGLAGMPELQLGALAAPDPDDPAFTAAKFGNGLSFGSTANAVATASYGTTGPVGGAWTLELWLRLDPVGGRVVALDFPSASRSLTLDIDATGSAHATVGLSSVLSVPVPSGSAFHRVAVRCNGADLSIFIDGAQTQFSPCDLPPAVQLERVVLGGTGTFRGIVDDVRVTNGARSDAELSESCQ